MKMMNDGNIVACLAERYKEYLGGLAYIPLQDLPKYEKAYKKVYGKNA